ncbi:MAG: butyrate kinase, partial [Enterocloster sp.]
MKPYKVLTINPGSTSTKVALFQGEECLYSQTVSHEAKELEQYASMSEQLPYRRDTVLTLLKEAGIRLEEVDVFVGRGGGLIAM